MITKSLWQENNGKMLLFEAIEMIEPGDKDKADVGATGVKSFSFLNETPNRTRQAACS
ncbi:hypothetical protein N7922_04920 [Kosakonia sp. ML.JS2a]|uniref:hypothetical protein n=1 Tax=Kosakonia sp. ML.JS2a TaxID=2980557 RepID=UPI0021D89FD8|nr:hypothetical protein [Kosakonia sp. ML.JS2a]UXY11879.1 hypothetical protein N7922_04920 [Kosakonia sp. ML.JS2a]